MVYPVFGYRQKSWMQATQQLVQQNFVIKIINNRVMVVTQWDMFYNGIKVSES
jgi:hypothetical protein